MKAIATAQATGPVTLTLELSCEGGQPTPAPVPVPAPGPAPPPPTTARWTLNGDLSGTRLLASGSQWFKRVDDLPAHPQSAAIIAAQPINWPPGGHRFHNDWGMDGGMPYSVGSGFPAAQIIIPDPPNGYPGESDLGPHPIPLDAPIEPGPDKHLLYHDTASGKTYELGFASRIPGGYQCQACAVWSRHADDDQRPNGNTSADAAGFQILNGLVRLDELKAALAKPDPQDQHLGHALRYTIPNTGHGFLYPARHYASLIPYSLPNRPPMGMRIRLKKGFDLTQFNQPTQVILRTLMLFGAFNADNGGAFLLSGTHDPGWAEFWDDLTGFLPGRLGIKALADRNHVTGEATNLFSNSVEVVGFADADVVTQI